MTVLADITEREQMQCELQRRDRELADFFDNGAIGMHWVDADGIVIRANRAELDMLGYSADEYIGQPIAKFHADAQAVEEIPRRLAAGETLRNYEARLIAKDGSIRHVLITSNVYRESGEFKHTCCFTIDITAQRAAQAALQASEANFRGFFDSVAIGAVQVNNAGRFIRVNDRYCEITGYSREELLSMGPFDLDHPDDREADFGQVVKFMTDPGGVYRAEKRYVRKDGSVAWVHVAANLLRDEAGQPLHSAAVVEDISERKRVEQALQEADRRKDEFLAMLSHELRNPLAPLKNAVELLSGANEQQKDWCRDLIERQLTHLTRLIDDLLDVSRITRDKLELRKQRIELWAVLQAAIEASRPMLAQCEQKLSVTIPPEPLYLDGDLVRLTQVFTNLLTNGAKFTEGAGTIHIAATREGTVIQVSVTDSGVGMSRDELERVFDKFYQVQHSGVRFFGGLGIGLSLVRQLVELHGGTVEAESLGPGRGSEFTVRLPVATTAPVAAIAPAAMHEPAARIGRRILIVDDNRDGADSLGRLLELMGHQTATEYDGQAALDRAKDFAADVVLLDLGMPNLDGFEICRRLREQKWPKQPRIVAMTGWGRDEDVARTQRAGFDAHLVKPVDRAALENLLEHPAPAHAAVPAAVSIADLGSVAAVSR